LSLLEAPGGQINGGRNGMFAAMSTSGGYTRGYSGMRLSQWAKEFRLADNFCLLTRLDGTGKLEMRLGAPSAKDGAV